MKAGGSQFPVKFSLRISFSKWSRLMCALVFNREGGNTLCSLCATSAYAVAVLGKVLLHQHSTRNNGQVLWEKEKLPSPPCDAISNSGENSCHRRERGMSNALMPQMENWEIKWLLGVKSVSTSALKPGISLAVLELQGYCEKITLHQVPQEGKSLCVPEKGCCGCLHPLSLCCC